MSKALVKKSLELLSFETNIDTDKRKKKKIKSAGALDLIPVNHRLISKDKKRGTCTSLLKRSSKLTINEARKQLQSQVDPVEENVERLLLLSGKGLDSDISKKIFDRAVKKRSKKQDKPKEEGTLFTEEDFESFEKEYLHIKSDEEHQKFKKEYLS